MQKKEKPYDVIFMERRIDKLVKHIEEIKREEKSPANRALVIRAKENLHSLRLWVKDRMRLEPTIEKEREDRRLQQILLNYEAQALGRINRKGQEKIAVVLNVEDKFSKQMEKIFPHLHPFQEKLMEDLGKVSFGKKIVAVESSRGWGKKHYYDQLKQMGMDNLHWPTKYEPKKQPTTGEIVKGMVAGAKKMQAAIHELAKSASDTIDFINAFTKKLATSDPAILISAGLASYCSDPEDEQPGSSVIQFHK